MTDTQMYVPHTLFESAGYSRQRAAGGITILRVGDARPETINAWYEDCKKLMAVWPGSPRLRYLHDIRHAGLPTLHATERVSQVLRRMRYIPVFDARGAILVNNPTLAELLASVMKRRPRADWQVRCFSDELAALAWLRIDN